MFPLQAALGYSATLAHAVMRRRLLLRPEVRNAALRQLYFTGIQALPYVTLLAVLFGSVVVTLVLSLIGTDNEFALKEVVWGGIRARPPERQAPPLQPPRCDRSHSAALWRGRALGGGHERVLVGATPHDSPEHRAGPGRPVRG